MTIEVTDSCKQWMDESVEFAKRIGLYDGDDHDKHYLKRALDQLDHFADNDRMGLAKCFIYKDPAPASFYCIVKRGTRARECMECHYKWTSRVVASRNSAGISGEATEFCPKCGHRTVVSAPIEYHEELMTIGCIYHGPHDGFGSGGAPTYAVSLTPEHGWLLHS